MSLTLIQGWAHISFLPPVHDNVYQVFRGHIISQTDPSLVYGIAGHYCPDPPNVVRNECLEPDLFYNVAIKDYRVDRHASLLVRRVATNDAAGLRTEADDDAQHNHGQKCSFETESFMTGQQARAHCQKYFKSTPEDAIVCLGQMTLMLDFNARETDA